MAKSLAISKLTLAIVGCLVLVSLAYLVYRGFTVYNPGSVEQFADSNPECVRIGPFSSFNIQKELDNGNIIAYEKCAPNQTSGKVAIIRRGQVYHLQPNFTYLEVKGKKNPESLHAFNFIGIAAYKVGGTAHTSINISIFNDGKYDSTRNVTSICLKDKVENNRISFYRLQIARVEDGSIRGCNTPIDSESQKELLSQGRGGTKSSSYSYTYTQAAPKLSFDPTKELTAGNVVMYNTCKLYDENGRDAAYKAAPYTKGRYTLANRDFGPNGPADTAYIRIPKGKKVTFYKTETADKTQSRTLMHDQSLRLFSSDTCLEGSRHYSAYFPDGTAIFRNAKIFDVLDISDSSDKATTAGGTATTAGGMATTATPTTPTTPTTAAAATAGATTTTAAATAGTTAPAGETTNSADAKAAVNTGVRSGNIDPDKEFNDGNAVIYRLCKKDPTKRGKVAAYEKGRYTLSNRDFGPNGPVIPGYISIPKGKQVTFFKTESGGDKTQVYTLGSGKFCLARRSHKFPDGVPVFRNAKMFEVGVGGPSTTTINSSETTKSTPAEFVSTLPPKDGATASASVATTASATITTDNVGQVYGGSPDIGSDMYHFKIPAELQKVAIEQAVKQPQTEQTKVNPPRSAFQMRMDPTGTTKIPNGPVEWKDSPVGGLPTISPGEYLEIELTPSNVFSGEWQCEDPNQTRENGCGGGPGQIRLKYNVVPVGGYDNLTLFGPARKRTFDSAKDSHGNDIDTWAADYLKTFENHNIKIIGPELVKVAKIGDKYKDYDKQFKVNRWRWKLQTFANTTKGVYRFSGIRKNTFKIAETGESLPPTKNLLFQVK
jgi:hypothetical protein